MNLSLVIQMHLYLGKIDDVVDDSYPTHVDYAKLLQDQWTISSYNLKL